MIDHTCTTESGTSAKLKLAICLPRALQDLVEVVMSVKSAVERQFGQEISIGGGQNRLASKLSEYANLLASQGALDAAMTYLGGGGSGDEEMEALRSRLNGAVGSRYQQQRGSISTVNQHLGKVRTTSSESYRLPFQFTPSSVAYSNIDGNRLSFVLT